MVYGDLHFFDIIIFAAIAIFIIFRFKSVLGKRIGFENKKQNSNNSSNEESANQKINIQSVPELQEKFLKFKIAYETLPNFDHKVFLEGAKIAFETIINSFNKGDKKTLKKLLSPTVYKSFEEAIDSNQIDSESQFYSLNIESIESVLVEGSVIKICINFISEQYKNNDENTVVKKQDSWTFEKEISSKNPNWILSST